LPRGKN
jgi:hypothetical protein